MLIHLVMAARPNIMKVAPIYHALVKTTWAQPVLVHTGQHYDENMSGALLACFDLPDPHYNLGIGSDSHAKQTGRTMVAYEELCLQQRPDLTVVVGDVNATVACALTAKKLDIALGHVEAGLRSFDRGMPEEINRLVTDSISDWFWTPSPDATERLIFEGNEMIDAYCYLEEEIRRDPIKDSFHLQDKQYALVTFHRPINVDSNNQLTILVKIIERISKNIKIIFPLHPRTERAMIKFGLYDRLASCDNIILCNPLTYIPFIKLMLDSTLIITDSGGVQEESSYLGVPCLTLRPNTERPITVTHGTNKLVTLETVLEEALNIINAKARPPRPIIPGWDGKAATRIVEHIQKNILAK